MDMDEILKVAEKLLNSSLPDSVLWVIVLLKFVLMPAGKRLNGLSAYIRRYLVIQRKQAAAFSLMANDVAEILKCLPDVRRKVRKTDNAQIMPTTKENKGYNDLRDY